MTRCLAATIPWTGTGLLKQRLVQPKNTEHETPSGMMSQSDANQRLTPNLNANPIRGQKRDRAAATTSGCLPSPAKGQPGLPGGCPAAAEGSRSYLLSAGASLQIQYRPQISYSSCVPLNLNSTGMTS